MPSKVSTSHKQTIEKKYEYTSLGTTKRIASEKVQNGISKCYTHILRLMEDHEAYSSKLQAEKQNEVKLNAKIEDLRRVIPIFESSYFTTCRLQHLTKSDGETLSDS